MAIKPYLIEVIGIDLWHAVEFSRYGCAPIRDFRPFAGQGTPPLFKGRRRNLVRHIRMVKSAPEPPF